MNIIGTTMFIRKDFIMYDSCLPAVLDPRLMLIYEILRRFIWRSPKASSGVRKLREAGLVVARVGMTKLAKLSGYSHKQRIPKIIDQLEQMGWLRKAKIGQFHTGLYVLGEHVQDSSGRKHEVLYADAVAQELIDWMNEEYTKEFKADASDIEDRDPNDSDDVPTYPYTELASADVDWRISKVREFLNKSLGEESGDSTEQTPCNSEEYPEDSTEQVLGDSVGDSTEQLSCDSVELPKSDSVELPVGNAVELPEEENSEAENLKIENGEAAASRLLSPLSDSGAAVKRSPERLTSESNREGEGDIERDGEERFPDKLKIPREVVHFPTSRTPTPSSKPVPSVDSPPTSPKPSWITKAMGGDKAKAEAEEGGTETSKEADAYVDMFPAKKALKPPREPSNLQAVVDVAAAAGKKSAERQLRKAKDRETKLASLGGKPVPVTRRRTLQTLENKWSGLMEVRFSGVTMAAWEAKERGQVWNLVEKYSGEIIGNALYYLVEQWDEIRTRMLKGRGGVPSVGFLLRFHDVLVVESQMWTEYRNVKKQVDEWYGDDLYKPDPPAELNAKYIKLRKEMANLGLPV